MGALAQFDERYGDAVRVVSVGGVSDEHGDVPTSSIELCGGCHVQSTAALFPFKIVSEGSVAAGMRRVEVASPQCHDSPHADTLTRCLFACLLVLRVHTGCVWPGGCTVVHEAVAGAAGGGNRAESH